MRRRVLLVALVLLALAQPLHAQIAFDAVAGDGTAAFATSQTRSFTMSATAGGCLVVGVLGDDVNDNITGVTYDGIAMTLVDKQNTTPTSVYWQYLYVLAAPHSGTHNLVANANASVHILTLAASYTGVSATKCGEVAVENNGTGDPYTSSLTTVTDNSWVVMLYSGSGALADSTGFTTRVYDGTGYVRLGDSGVVTPAGSKSLSLTGGGIKMSELVAIGPSSTTATPRLPVLGVQ